VSTTLPPLPKAFGTIRHVFKSALLATQGKPNPLQFSSASRVLVVLIDGLGVEQIKQRAGHAPWLASLLNAGTISHCAFPATTSANIASFGTGLWPGEHGLIGHLVWDRVQNERMNLLVGWNERTDPLIWQPHATVAEQALDVGIVTHVVAASEYRDTPYTRATMRGSQFSPAEKWSERFDRGLEILNDKTPSITYLYIPELDKYGHKNGWTSSGYATMLEELDVALRSFVSRQPKGTGVVITSDHGMVETAKDRQLVLDDLLEKDGHTEFYGGDTRAGFVYLDDASSTQQVISNLQPMSYAFDALPIAEAIEMGLFGPICEQAKDRLPEILLLAKGNYTLYHSKFFKPRSFEMIAHHGSLSPAETRVPLIRFGL
jgi:predicted AlkP superfamily pyrophosphatase or phosphodiesterase